jgi:hypothetical protein
MVNLGAVAARSGTYPARFSTLVRGDWNSDGVSNEIFASDPATGEYRVFDGTSGNQLAAGLASPAEDQFVAGDFDGDGLMNDLVRFDTETGYGTLWTWGPGGVFGRSQWRWSPGWDKLVALDGDSDGRVDETFIFDPDSGVWSVHKFVQTMPTYLNSGSFAPGWEDFVAGDLDAQGNSDDLFIRDRDSGIWVVVNWFSYGDARALPRQVATSRWLPDWDRFVMGDWDTDGRTDDMYIYDADGGGWTILSWHRYVPSYAVISSYVPGLDTFLSGTFG